MNLDPHFREVGEPTVTMTFSVADAESVQGALSDVLCWIRGWQAGASEAALSNAPIGVDTLRDLNRAVKRAIDDATPRKQS